MSSTRILVQSYTLPGTSVTNNPQAAFTTSLTSKELPNTVLLKFVITIKNNANEAFPEVSNGTGTTQLGIAANQGSGYYLYTYVLPKNYVKAEGTTTVKVNK